MKNEETNEKSTSKFRIQETIKRKKKENPNPISSNKSRNFSFQGLLILRFTNFSFYNFQVSLFLVFSYRRRIFYRSRLEHQLFYIIFCSA